MLNLSLLLNSFNCFYWSYVKSFWIMNLHIFLDRILALASLYILIKHRLRIINMSLKLAYLLLKCILLLGLQRFNRLHGNIVKLFIILYLVLHLLVLKHFYLFYFFFLRDRDVRKLLSVWVEVLLAWEFCYAFGRFVEAGGLDNHVALLNII